jgi:hypothetical protein
MKPKDNDENAKDPAWQTPMDIATVGKGAYNASYDSANGRQDNVQGGGQASALPANEPTADPAGKALQHGTAHVKKLAM